MSSNEMFPETRNSLIRIMKSGDEAAKQAALVELVEIYHPVLLRCLKRWKRKSDNDADDFTQDFIIKKMIEKRVNEKTGKPVLNVFEGYLNQRGKCKFRTYLWRCMNYFLIDVYRKDDDTSFEYFFDDSSSSSKDDPREGEFYEEYAREVFKQTLKEMRQHCIETNKEVLWKVFCHRKLRPLVGTLDETPYETLTTTLGLKSSKQARSALVTAGRMFQRFLEDTIAAYTDDSAEAIEQEKGDLLNSLKNGEIKGLAELLPPDVLESSEEESVCNLTSVVVREIIEGCTEETDDLSNGDTKAIWLTFLNSSIDNLEKENGETSSGQQNIGELLSDQSASREQLDLLRKTSRDLYRDSKLPVHLCLMCASIAKGIESFGKEFTSVDLSDLIGRFQSFTEVEYVDETTKSLFLESIVLLKK